MAPPPANEHDPVVKSLSHQMLRTRLHQESPPRQESLLIPHTDPTSRTFPIRASFPIVVTCATDAPPARPPTQHLPRYAAATPAHQHNTYPATLLQPPPTNTTPAPLRCSRARAHACSRHPSAYRQTWKQGPRRRGSPGSACRHPWLPARAPSRLVGRRMCTVRRGGQGFGG